MEVPYNENNDHVQTAGPLMVAALLAVPAVQLPQQNVGQASGHSYIYPSTIFTVMGILAYGVAAHYGIYPFKPLNPVPVEKQLTAAAANMNAQKALDIFKSNIASNEISEKAISNAIGLLCFNAMQENTVKNTEITLEFLEVAKENNYSLPNFDIKTKAPDCLELVGVAEKIQELIVEGG